MSHDHIESQKCEAEAYCEIQDMKCSCLRHATKEIISLKLNMALISAENNSIGNVLYVQNISPNGHSNLNHVMTHTY